jgi:hypothetical protein
VAAAHLEILREQVASLGFMKELQYQGNKNTDAIPE